MSSMFSPFFYVNDLEGIAHQPSRESSLPAPTYGLSNAMFSRKPSEALV